MLQVRSIASAWRTCRHLSTRPRRPPRSSPGFNCAASCIVSVLPPRRSPTVVCRAAPTQSPPSRRRVRRRSDGPPTRSPHRRAPARHRRAPSSRRAAAHDRSRTRDRRSPLRSSSHASAAAPLRRCTSAKDSTGNGATKKLRQREWHPGRWQAPAMIRGPRNAVFTASPPPSRSALHPASRARTSPRRAWPAGRSGPRC